LLGLVLLLGLAAGVWLSAVSIGAEDGLPTRASVHTITALHQGLRVYWYEPGEDGGSAITGYEVEYRSLGAEQWTDAGHTGTSQPAVIAELRFDTAYEVRVRARNANGAGPWSTVESRRTSRDDGKPDPPWPPTLEPGDGRLKVSWTAPAYTGGRPITGYRVRYTTDNAATWRTWAQGGNPLITGTSTTITGLDGGIAVGVAVGALNARGQGRYSSPIAEATPAPAASPPPAPTLRVTPMNQALYVSWSPVSAKPPVGAYELEYQWIGWNESDWLAGWSRVGASLGSDAVGYPHRNLSPDRRYRYRLRASNDAGAGDWSAVVPQAGAQPRPDKPRLAAQTAASGSVKLSWSSGPASATHWEYRWLREDGVWGRWTRIAGSDAETTEHVVSGLTEDARYQFLLRVQNASGTGPASTPVGAVAGLTPTKPGDRETLAYTKIDSVGGAVQAGSYALLKSTDDLTSGIANFSDAPTATGLLVNTIGYAGRSYADFLDNVAVGLRFTWRVSATCWSAYKVTALLNDPTAPARKLFAVQSVAQDPCTFRIGDLRRGRISRLVWGPPPSEPIIGADGIRILPHRYPVEGGHTYRIRDYEGVGRITIDVPRDMRLIYTGSAEEFGGQITVSLKDESSGAILAIDYDTGEEVGRYIPEDCCSNGVTRDVVAMFDELVASARVQCQR
jgi:hypothetical protein